MLRELIARLAGLSRPSETERLLDAAHAARATGDLDQAVSLAARLVAEQPERVPLRCLLAEAYAARGDDEAAEAQLRDAIRMAPSDAQAHELLGQTLLRRGATLEAAHMLHRAIELDWSSQSARVELAAALTGLGRPGEAVPLLRWVLKREPDLADAHRHYGVALQEMGQLGEALPHFQRAAALEPRRIDYLNHLAMCLRGLDRHDEAVRELERARELAPGDPATLTNLATLLRELGRPGEAHATVAPLVEKSPDLVAARCVFALALQDLGDVAGAFEQFDAALARAPGSGSVRLCRAMLRLSLGDYARGWEDYEGRFESDETPRRGFPYPDWEGGPLAGRAVLVYAEQGLGDEIMFASCLPDLMGEAKRVVVECDPRLAPLFRRSFPGADVHGAPRTAEHKWLQAAGAIDVQLGIGSLPRRYRRDVAQFSVHRGYLLADAERVARYRGRLAALGSRRKVGLAWRGGIMRTRQVVRSVTPELLAPLLARQDLQLVSLQRGDVAQDLARFQAINGEPIVHWPEAVSDPEELAALVTALDAVVTVCCSVVHLGGALGVRVLTLVPTSPEWRYLARGDRMPWYPSVELLRQESPGDWEAVVRAAASRV